eukprot:CAMPEP_0181236640 /NCGR_PEP_ID=MMETSP1096-20121128/38298_1 /TAXON_ID=156174 ORGANISM="Chrysochromulina ericina, Strain CCMP281" /NCGR_SAMPLE_ID=MMETSP1096 /ASSEMBLY_ACC=CAM_ASM_000453 /LENGTH=48 /DNA_ID= /DNA_START= /DNA_END= /DNA_ORIENTATION=
MALPLFGTATVALVLVWGSVLMAVPPAAAVVLACLRRPEAVAAVAAVA